MRKKRLFAAILCAAVVSAPDAASASAMTCPTSGLTTSLALQAAIQRIVGWEQSENLSPLTIRESRQAMEAEKPRRLVCSGGVCVVIWRSWPVSVWCSDGRIGVGIGGPGSPWATIPFGDVVAWNNLPS
jgi:hypothetical protein